LLRLESVRKRLGGRLVIDRADLTVGQGDILCIAGPSGAGKSTLLELMAGVLAPDEGYVKRNCPAALAFQDDALIPWLDAAGNLDYAIPALPPEDRARWRKRWLTCFGLSGELRPDAMSGGMKRRLNLARAFASARPLLLLDEPYAFLDAHWQRQVSEEIRRFAGGGGAVVVVTHQPEPLEDLECRFVSVEGPPVVLRACP
jgi:ABC-type nitrate/sulfonate/bicarbonate transport system ATPase subunit